jgi:hypothetical protein
MAEYELTFPAYGPGVPPRDVPYVRGIGHEDRNRDSWGTVRSEQYGHLYDNEDSPIEQDYTPILKVGIDENYFCEALFRTVVAFSLEALPFGWTATAATFHMHIKDFFNDTDLSNADRSIVLVAMDESLKESPDMRDGDYSALLANFTELSDRKYIADTGNSWTWTFNAPGLAYLNTVRHKSNYPKQVNFGLALVADVLDNDPTPTNRDDRLTYIFYSQEDQGSGPEFSMTYDTSIRINIGDAWKSVEEVKVNVGDAWKDVTDMDDIQIQVGDDWKDLY